MQPIPLKTEDGEVPSLPDEELECLANAKDLPKLQDIVFMGRNFLDYIVWERHATSYYLRKTSRRRGCAETIYLMTPTKSPKREFWFIIDFRLDQGCEVCLSDPSRMGTLFSISDRKAVYIGSDVDEAMSCRLFVWQLQYCSLAIFLDTLSELPFDASISNLQAQVHVLYILLIVERLSPSSALPYPGKPKRNRAGCMNDSLYRQLQEKGVDSEKPEDFLLGLLLYFAETSTTIATKQASSLISSLRSFLTQPLPTRTLDVVSDFVKLYCASETYCFLFSRRYGFLQTRMLAKFNNILAGKDDDSSLASSVTNRYSCLSICTGDSEDSSPPLSPSSSSKSENPKSSSGNADASSAHTSVNPSDDQLLQAHWVEFVKTQQTPLAFMIGDPLLAPTENPLQPRHLLKGLLPPEILDFREKVSKCDDPSSVYVNWVSSPVCEIFDGKLDLSLPPRQMARALIDRCPSLSQRERFNLVGVVICWFYKPDLTIWREVLDKVRKDRPSTTEFFSFTDLCKMGRVNLPLPYASIHSFIPYKRNGPIHVSPLFGAGPD